MHACFLVRSAGQQASPSVCWTILGDITGDNVYVIHRGAHEVEINISILKPAESNQFEDEVDRRARPWRDEEDSS